MNISSKSNRFGNPLLDHRVRLFQFFLVRKFDDAINAVMKIVVDYFILMSYSLLKQFLY